MMAPNARGVTPEALPIIIENFPADLVALDHWGPWRWEFRGGKWTKVLIDAATGRRASTTDPATWTACSKAVRHARKNLLPGVGFVFTNSPFAGVDLDNCRGPETCHVEARAREIVAELDSYAEVSPSGTGIKVFVRGELPPGRRRKGNIEMYDSGRFFTVTGHGLPDAPAGVMERTEQLAALHHRVFGSPPAKPQHARPADLPGGADLDDAELIRRATAASNGEKFTKLWAGDTGGYADGGNEGRSEADLALCSLLAFWTGPDEDRIDGLFRQSGLMRAKWDEVHFSDGRTYGAATVERAIAGRSEFWSERSASMSGKVYARRKAVISVG